MRIGIITLPLHNNYGGILQNYALQQVLKRLGHDPITIDYLPQMKLWRYCLSSFKSLVLYLFPEHRRPFTSRRAVRKPAMEKFLVRNIECTRTVENYSPVLLKEYDIEGLVVGSDQVWRPRYNYNLEDKFLSFARDIDIPKIAYAASFGVDAMEFNKLQLKRCVSLVRQFNGVSVREMSAVGLCETFFRVKAECVLDPTLILNAEDYMQICTEISKNRERTLVCYILDLTPKQRSYIDDFARKLRLTPKIICTDGDTSLSPKEWVAAFRDAEYIVTNSFHGTIFSIIFRKPFVTIVNNKRGADRFVSLLDLFQLKSRLINSMSELSEELYAIPIDWCKTESAMAIAREKSIKFLLKAFNS